MAKVVTGTLEHTSQLDLKVNNVSMMQFTTAGMSRPNGKDAEWFTDLIGDNFAVGGSGALAQAVLDIGSFRKYNAWELINSASSDPYLDVNFWLPPDYDATSLKVTLQMVKTATATGTDIDTRVRLGCAGVGDSLDVTVSSAVDVVTTVGANSALFTVTHTLTPANASAGRLCHGFIQRVSTLPADDYTGSVYLLGARVEYS